MSGSSNNAGKILGAATTVASSATLLSHGWFKALAAGVLAIALIGAMLVLFSATARRILVRK